MSGFQFYNKLIMFNFKVSTEESKPLFDRSRAALVQNHHLAGLAARLGLERFLLFSHGNDLCHDSEISHALANAFEALMAAIFLDSNIGVSAGVVGL